MYENLEQKQKKLDEPLVAQKAYIREIQYYTRYITEPSVQKVFAENAEKFWGINFFAMSSDDQKALQSLMSPIRQSHNNGLRQSLVDLKALLSSESVDHKTCDDFLKKVPENHDKLIDIELQIKMRAFMELTQASLEHSDKKTDGVAPATDHDKESATAKGKVSPKKKAGIGMFSGAMVSVAVGGAVLGLTLGNSLPLGLPIEAGFATAGFFALVSIGLAIGAGVSFGANQRVDSQDHSKGDTPEQLKGTGVDQNHQPEKNKDVKAGSASKLDSELGENKPESQHTSTRKKLTSEHLSGKKEKAHKRERYDRTRSKKRRLARRNRRRGQTPGPFPTGS